MSDLLVRLYDLPNDDEALEKLRKEDIVIRRAFSPDSYEILDFVEKTTGMHAKGEALVSLTHQPVTMFIATIYDKIIGYACFEATNKAFFGPTEVLEEYRGKGIGRALLIESLKGLKELGYGYAIIGSAGPVDFYTKNVGAIVIPSSNPGLYRDMLSLNKREE